MDADHPANGVLFARRSTAAGAVLAAAGALNFTNGSWDSTKGLDAGPANSVHAFGKYFEIGRMDPFPLIFALGGLIGQSMREGYKEGAEYDAYEGVRAAMATALIHIPRDAFLGKSYLTGLKELNEIIFSRNEATLGDKLTRHVSGILTRLVPLSGESRQVNNMLAGDAVEAITLTDQILRTIPGSGLHSPVRRDLLGDPIKGPILGFAAGDSEKTNGAPMDAVKRELRDLNVDIPNIRKADPAGFDLSAKQLDRLREIRGKVATNRDGETMREALAGLFGDSWYKGLPDKEQKKQAVLEVIRDFNAPARERLRKEDPSYDAKVIGHRALKEYEADGMSHMKAIAAAEADVKGEGLPDANLRSFSDYLRAH